jgi:hypothetical protein
MNAVARYPSQVYRNLHGDNWSIVDRRDGKVHGHSDTVCLCDAKFVVQPAGNRATRSERRKRVHAFVRGTVVAVVKGVFDSPNLAPRTGWEQIRYNPYEHTSFVAVTSEGEKPVTTAVLVELDPAGRVWAKGAA